MRIGFVVNPIAGMGGRVGLKGTDGVLEEALSLGAEPVAPARAREFLERLGGILRRTDLHAPLEWLTCAGDMGENELAAVPYPEWSVATVLDPGDKVSTRPEDTKEACRLFMEKGMELLVFCGGDGTARDVMTAVGHDVPVLGIPSGVKMHSGVFGNTPGASAYILYRWLCGEMELTEGEVMDLDEVRYRRGEWNISLFGTMLVPHEPTYIQASKFHAQAVGEDEIKDDIARTIEEMMEQDPSRLYILGSGSTLMHIKERLGFEGTLLGIDAYRNGTVLGTDLNERDILKMLDEHERASVILSPIGAQGFILGRGNLQLSARVLDRIGIDNVVVVSTPAKLNATPSLRVDTGDADLDARFAEKGYMKVITMYRTSRMVPISAGLFGRGSPG